jgi:hypothetical protein
VEEKMEMMYKELKKGFHIEETKIAIDKLKEDRTLEASCYPGKRLIGGRKAELCG